MTPNDQNAWDQLSDESATWYDRFQRHYLSVGPGRSIDDAWRRHQTSRNKAATKPQRAAGSWNDAAKKYRWAERAHAWDAHQGKLLIQALAADAIEAHRRHSLVVRAHVNRLSVAGQQIDYGRIDDPARWLQALDRIIGMERQVYRAPVHAFAIEEAGKLVNEAAREVATQASVENDTQWDVTPADIVEVARLWAELGISIHDDPATIVGPLALPSPPATESAGS